MRSIYFILISVFAVLGVSGCVSTKSEISYLNEKITSPRLISISGVRAPWVFEIEKRLKQRGFTINRMVSQNVTIKQISETKSEAYNEATSRYILRLDGHAPNTSMTRCIGGGYNFDYINVELIDVRENSTVLTYSNSGYSEGCQPFSGSIFEDIVELLDKSWHTSSISRG
ncbi:hypothetical protein GCM10009123_16540 [Kangiella japonica]|uniref:DUF4136 domain-containing protein n=1 Tax=Kangiella japonica TaxID=647384 RepID=A0ABN0T1V3_9GAMM